MQIERRTKYKGKGSTINKSNTKIDMNFDINSLNLMSSYVLSENKNIRRSHLINMRNLFEIINIDIYVNDIEKMKRIDFIKKGLEGRLVNNIKNSELLLKFINGGISEIDVIDIKNFTKLNSDELSWINETVSESLKYAFIYNDMDRMLDVITRFKASDYRNRGEIVQEFETLIREIQTKFRRVKPENVTDTVFSLKKNFEDTVTDVYERLTNPSSKLYTGMQGFNELLGGAFESTRTYMLLGLTGGGKSLTLLNLAYQLKKYNSHYIPKDPTKTPVILYITMENTVDESVARLFSISTDKGDIENYDVNEVIKMFKEDGELYLTDQSPIDLMIKYIPDRSIDTGDLYTVVEDLEDEGYEVICLIQDHIKKIRSCYKQTDIRLELGSIVNEFKVLASLKDMTVITNSHLNREAARTIDEASKSNKSDLIRLLGRANTGESMLMLDNLDAAYMIAQEYDDQGNKYMGVQRIKKRFKASERNVIFQPYTRNDGIQLVEDINMTVPVFRDTLKSLPTETNMYNNGIPKKSVYQNDIKQIDDILGNNNPKIMEDTNIFAASRYRSTQLPTSIADENTMPMQYETNLKLKQNKPLINPFIKIS